MNLIDYDIIIVNSSGGKDSVCALFEIVRMAQEQGYPKANIFVSHQDLKNSEWKGTKELVFKQSAFFGIAETFVSRRRNKAGYEETLLEYALRRGKWPSRNQRWCTSDFKRGPGARVLTQLTNGLGKCRVLYVFGFRAEESPDRAKKIVLKLNVALSTKSREVWDYLPIHTRSTQWVWHTIHSNKLPYHFAYDLGMPRLSCVFCIFSPFDALVLAGIHNPELLDEYIAVQKHIGHLFRDGFNLETVKEAIESGYVPKQISNWVM